MPSVYRVEHESEVGETLEDMRVKLAKEFGVTLTGNRVTLNWHKDGQLVSAHMIIDEVITPRESEELSERDQRMQALITK